MSSQEISLENISNDVTSIRNKINELSLSNREKEELEKLKQKLEDIKENLSTVVMYNHLGKDAGIYWFIENSTFINEIELQYNGNTTSFESEYLDIILTSLKNIVDILGFE